MSKKLCFLMFFVLVLSLGGLAQADVIEVNNPSFEYDINGVQITEQIWCGNMLGWQVRNETDWGGWDGYMFATSEEDPALNFPTFQAVVGTVAFTSASLDNEPNVVQIYQILEDPNAVIAADRRYTLTFNAINPSSSPNDADANAGLFYSTGLDVNGGAPSVNDVTLASSKTPLPSTFGDYSNYEEVSLSYLALTGAGSIGETLIIRLSVPGDSDWGYYMFDNVRVKWSSAGSAWNPSPVDEAEDVVRDANLTWSSGEWADEHIVYFSDDFNKVSTRHQDANQGRQSANLFDPTPGGGLLVPGQTYHWTITEVNDPNFWLGDIWSFTAGGRAKNPYPANWAGDIPALDLRLYWEAGAGAASHDVYFGTSKADVENATTASDPNLFRGNQLDVNYPVEDLDVGEPYFWRIDEVNTGSFVKGDVWRFTTGVFLLVDSFEAYRYQTNQDLRDAWKDFNFNPSGLNRAEVFIESTDASKFLDTGEQSMRYYYRNFTSAGKWYHSWAEAALPLEVGTDWTIGGVKALVVNFCGDTANGQEATKDYTIANDQMWLELVDGGANAGIVQLPDMNDVTDANWHTWNISLQDPCFSGVDMNDIATVYIGFGGAKGGKSKTPGAGSDDLVGDTVWFDDIQLYPPRCMPSITGIDVLHDLGDFTEDCNTDYLDLDIMTTDWLVSDAQPLSVPPAAPPEVWYRFDDGAGTVVKSDGSWSGYNITFHSPNEPNEPFWTSDTAPALDPCDPNYALDFDGVNDKIEIPNDAPSKFVGTQNMSITLWAKATGGVIQWQFPTVVESRYTETAGTGDTNGTGFGLCEWGELCYYWNNLYWDFHTDFWPTATDPPILDTWCFWAVTIEPTKAVVYFYDGVLNSATNTATHAPLQEWGDEHMNWIGCSSNGTTTADYSHFQGKVDDVRLYNKTLSLGEIKGMLGLPSDYIPNTSVANISPKLPPPTSYDPNDPDIVDFRDYSILAENWLDEHLWP